jgi:hypothetical protein
VVDRGEPEVSRSEWHADGTASEDDCGSGPATTVPLGRWVRLVLGDHEPRGKHPQGARQLSLRDEVCRR